MNDRKLCGIMWYIHLYTQYVFFTLSNFLKLLFTVYGMTICEHEHTPVCTTNTMLYTTDYQSYLLFGI